MKITEQQEEARALYSAIMTEVKVRHQCIRELLYGVIKVDPPFIREFCFLQFRMICELIALGCLVAHGDIKATQSRTFRKLWAANQIMEELEKLHPEFFPEPFVAKRTGPTSSHLNEGPSEAMTKGGLLDLYGRCGGVLHRGSRSKLLTREIPKQTNFPDIARYSESLRDLLDNHIVLMLGGQMVFICEMAAGTNGAVLTRIATASGPSKRVIPAGVS